MKTKVVEPLIRAWSRMVKILFSPFMFDKWFTLGFGAWLANLFGAYCGYFNFSLPLNSFNRFNFPGNLLSSPKTKAFSAVELLNQYGKAVTTTPETTTDPNKSIFLGIGLIIIAVFIAVIFFSIAFSLLLYWLKSRAEFIFIDNLVKDRGAIAAPWKEYSKQGNSAFLWRLAMKIIIFIMSLVMLGMSCTLFIPWFSSCLKAKDIIQLDATAIAGIIVLITSMIAVSVFSFFVFFFFRQFVVPLMYINKISALEAWAAFRPLLKQAPGAFALYCLVYAVLNTIINIAIPLVCVMTCCIGLMILSIPYIWAVILLPVLALTRLYSLEFLAGLGENFNAFHPIEKAK